MRRAAKRDANEPEIIGALKGMGCTVQQVNEKGAPDLLVGIRGLNLLFEVKDGDKPPSAQLLTKDQIAWHLGWRGQVHTVTTPAEAVELVTDAIEALEERAAKRWADDDFACDDNALEETQRTHGGKRT